MFLTELSLPKNAVKYLTGLDFIRLQNAYEKATGKCDACDASKASTNCSRVSVTFNATDHKLYFENTECPKLKTAIAEKKARDIIRIAKLPPIFENLRADDYHENASNGSALDAAEEAILEDRSLYIYGACGTGKTMLASIIAIERAHRGKRSTFINAADFLEELSDFSGTDNEESRLRKLRRLYDAPCLIVDDLGAEKATEWATTMIFKLYNNRYNKNAQTITTSNYSPDEMIRHIGARVTRRALHNATIVEIK